MGIMLLVSQASGAGGSGIGVAAVQDGPLGSHPLDRGDHGAAGEHTPRADRQQGPLRAAGTTDGKNREHTVSIQYVCILPPEDEFSL